MKPLRLPWAGSDVPHVILDISRECNISCASCYTRRSFRKSRAEVAADLRAALAHRRLHTVTISGGEPTLHPQLPEMVADIHDHGLRTVLLSNGVRLDDLLLAKLRRAGLDAVLLHIDRGQHRPDLPNPPTAETVAALRRQLGERVSSHGIQAGLVATLYRETLDDIGQLVDLVVGSPHLHFLLATTSWDAARFRGIRGDLRNGFAMPSPVPEATQAARLSLAEIAPLLATRGMRPFGRVGASDDSDRPRWLCYTSAAVFRGETIRRHASLASGLSERILVRLVRLLTGRYMYHVRQNAGRLRCQLALNALSGGNLPASLSALIGSLAPGSRIYEKRIVLQQGPSIAPGGRIVHCAHCPDATIVDGQLVPVCISDGWEGKEHAAARP